MVYEYCELSASQRYGNYRTMIHCNEHVSITWYTDIIYCVIFKWFVNIKLKQFSFFFWNFYPFREQQLFVCRLSSVCTFINSVFYLNSVCVFCMILTNCSYFPKWQKVTDICNTVLCEVEPIYLYNILLWSGVWGYIWGMYGSLSCREEDMQLSHSAIWWKNETWY